MSIAPGRSLGHYRLIEKIGAGGMGVVYRAEDTRLRRQVALKVLPPEVVVNEERRRRFLREARTAAAVNHPNIATIHEIDEADGVVFITMELVEGTTLRKQLGGKPLPIQDTLRIATEIAEGLAEAHRAHVIHRDLKPENVIVNKAGQVKVLDFGLAKIHEERDEARSSQLSQQETVSGEMTREGKVLGTPVYMSPEQARGEHVDSRSDLFAFGTTLYEMSTGVVPFRGKTITDTLSAILRDEPVPASQVNARVPLELGRIISKCLEKEPRERYQHTDDLVVDLRHLKREADLEVQHSPTPGGPVLRPPERRTGKHRLVLLGALAIVLIGIGAYALWKSQPAPRFQKGDVLIVADFDNRSQSPALGVQIRDAFEVMMAESQFIQVNRWQRGRASTETLDSVAARRLCSSGNCRGFLTGTIDEDQSGFTVSSFAYHLNNSSPAMTRIAHAVSVDGMLALIHDMTSDLRSTLGESPQSVATAIPPTTRSLSAYQVLASAEGLEGADKRLALMKRALKIDPDFTCARMRLAEEFWSLGEFEAWREEWRELYGRRAQLPERLRLRIEMQYLRSTFDLDSQFAQAKAYVELYPLDYATYRDLCYLHGYAYEDLGRAIGYCQEAHRLRRSSLTLGDAGEYLRLQGDVEEMGRLARDFRDLEPDSFVADRMFLWIAMVSDEEIEVRDMVEHLSQESIRARQVATNDFVEWLLASGRLREAREQVSITSRLSREANDMLALNWAEARRAWLAKRNDENPHQLPEEALKPVRENLGRLPVFAAFSVETQLAEPLADLIDAHTAAAMGSESRFVREELQYARGCLAMLRGNAQQARELLEPLARDSNLTRRHRILGRAYEDLGLLSKAADEYEASLENLNLKWNEYDDYLVPAEQALYQFRLARVYDRLGDTNRAHHWYERFTEDWKSADPDIPELIAARARLAELMGGEGRAEIAVE